MPGRGFAPNPQSRRQQGGVTASLWVDLPAEGYTGPVPDWPLAVPPTDTEAGIWARIWRTPQAAAWVTLGWLDEVTNYVRLMAASQGRIDIKIFAEARQCADRLGLNTPAMLRNHWRIRANEVVAPVAVPSSPARRILTVAEDAVAGA
jgi:hypothetical protein